MVYKKAFKSKKGKAEFKFSHFISNLLVYKKT
jgi:hypothetical protein